MIPKDLKIYILHYDVVRGDVLRPPHGTTPDALKIKSVLNKRPLEARDRNKIYEKLNFKPSKEPIKETKNSGLGFIKSVHACFEFLLFKVVIRGKYKNLNKITKI